MGIKKVKKRLDLLVFERNFSTSRENASRLILAGKVKVNSKLVDKPGTQIDQNAMIELLELDKFVGKGGKKIESVYKKFRTDFKNKVVADIGSSTGGFTDFALQKGAKKVYAVDVGYGQLAYSLRMDKRVVNMERTDIRSVESFPDKIDIFVVDVSFISLKKILPKIKELINKQDHKAEIIALVKPQFEVGKEIANKFKGVIKDPEIQKNVVKEISDFGQEKGFAVISKVMSAVKGEKGNQEYFIYLRYPKKVLVFGTFDLLHKGHIFFLKEASKYGKVKVIVPKDKKVFCMKKRMPVNFLKQRIKSLNKQGYEAEVENENPWQNVIQNKTDFIVLGYDQNWENEVKKAVKKSGYIVKVKKIKKSYRPDIYKSSIIRKLN